jgi:hypothetical protein
MPPRRRTSKETPAKLAKRMKRRWRVVLLRAKGEILGTVEATDREGDKAVAAVQFDLNEIQRNRIIVQELACRALKIAFRNGFIRAVTPEATSRDGDAPRLCR